MRGVFACLVPLLFALTGLGQLEHARTNRPLELIFVRSDEGTCGIITSRHTQHLRGLKAGAVHATRLPTQSGHQRVSLIAYDERSLWNAAQTECGDIFSHESLFSDVPSDQGVLTMPPSMHSENFEGQAPPLQVEPLIQSGDSSNRVDLVFFSDGCRFYAIFACVNLTH